MNSVAQGEKTVQDLKDYIARDAENYPHHQFRLMFTSNHDENSWNGTEFERLGDAVKVMAVLCFTLPEGQPLVYTGQEIGMDHRLAFFEKDPVPDWTANGFTAFYKDLIAMRHANAALSAGGKGGPLVYIDGMPEGVLAFSRAVEGNKVTVCANLTAAEVALPDGRTLPAWGYDIVCE